MSKITVSAEMLALLRGAEEEVELVGPNGEWVGRFVPSAQLDDLYAEPTRAELDAIEAAGGGIPHEEVVKRLGLE